MAPIRSPPVGRMACTGLPRVALRPLQRVCEASGDLVPGSRVVAAVRSAPLRMTFWWPTFVGCSKLRRFMAILRPRVFLDT